MVRLVFRLTRVVGCIYLGYLLGLKFKLFSHLPFRRIQLLKVFGISLGLFREDHLLAQQVVAYFLSLLLLP